MIGGNILNAKNILKEEKKILSELILLEEGISNSNSEALVNSQMNKLKVLLRNKNLEFIKEIYKIYLINPLASKDNSSKDKIIQLSKLDRERKDKIKSNEKKYSKLKKNKFKKLRINDFYKIAKIEKATLKRLNKKEKKQEIKFDQKPSLFINLANTMFFNISRKLSRKPFFHSLEKDLNKTNLQFILPSYIAVMFFSMFVTFVLAFFVAIFFLFFNIGATLPIITFVTEDLGIRFFKVFWIVLVFPIAAFVLSYFYPSMERKSSEAGINQELPFATIHMSAISGSMVEPSKIFKILLSTKEYPFIGKELTKLLNEINIYGNDLVTALKKTANNSPSVKLADLLNGLATTITSGGSLSSFFDKRSETLLFEHRLEKEKAAKAAETFMDIYISVVIAAPMILMLLLVMMKISGLGLSLSTQMIGFVMVLGVSILNIIFLTFLFLKNPTE